MAAILWKNLSFIELLGLSILQLITIQNNSDLFARWPQYKTTNVQKAS